MKSGLVVIVLFLFLLKEHPLAGANSIKDVSKESIYESAENKSNSYCFSIFKPILDYFVKNADEAKAELRKTIEDLQSQLKNAKDRIEVKDILMSVKDENISDLRNHIKSLETTLSERSKQLSECRESDFPDTCPSGGANEVYQIKPRGMEPFKVPCVSSAAGWTVIQRRFDGSENFDRNWTDYRQGFGNIRGEFFIGLEKLHRMTVARPHELYIKLGKVDGSTSYARYDDFQIGSEAESYELKKTGKYSGEAGDSIAMHLGNKFSTFDRDNDRDTRHCAGNKCGGWWYNDCAQSSLNGQYYKNGQSDEKNGINWASWHDYTYTISLTFAEMMIRPKSL
ncbi:microfibril-associated glycoprotein 4-like [Drosophila takahashii]|uniref:microfibril-associated glycoprotein 4-like n=1 Tax=Drosophila takahashii TaxID=29030 RepID=UPI001CF8145A|nr:microfibril-associated glycoprotein 4-like [Drosophila takahashii]